MFNDQLFASASHNSSYLLADENTREAPAADLAGSGKRAA